MTSAMENQDKTVCVTDYSQEFKIEMENSISKYFLKCNLEDDENNINRSETLVNNMNNEIEYISPAPSLNGISDFMIHQVFSTDKIVPIEFSSDNEDVDMKTENENENKDNINDTSDIKMNSCNSDVTLNINDINRTDDENISKSFATEFIDLLDINMKELNSKKDDFHVIGLKKIDEEKEEKDSNSPVSVKFTNDVEEILKKNKRSKHISIFKFDRKFCNSNLSRSKSDNTSSSSSVNNDNVSKCKLRKSKSKLGFSKIFKSVKRRISHQNLKK